MIHLGLDISTTVTGWCIANSSELIEFGYIDMATKSTKTIYDRVELAICKIIELVNKYDIDKVIIEDNLLQFASGRTRANTIVLLAKANGIISYYISKILNLQIVHVNASTARKQILGKSRDKSFDNTKEFILASLVDKFGHDFLKKLPTMKTKDKLAKPAFDICDAVIVALYKPN